MIFYPAIDLKEGRCVRLRRGDMTTATVFNDDPAAQAAAFAEAGAQWLHMVDLDGAIAGQPRNAAAVMAVLQRIEIPVQLGGGIRSLDRVRFWLEKGVARVILGTAAVEDRQLVAAACAAYPGRIAIALDASGGRLALKGWTALTDISAREAALALEASGAATLIYTDISRDGMRTGPDLEGTLAIARAVRVPVIASGGVSTLADLRALREAGEGLIAGVIAGRALYDGSFGIGEAIRVLGGADAEAAGGRGC